jgi:hypothetical protein
MSLPNDDTLEKHIGRYEVSARHNDELFGQFTALTDEVETLKRHRDWVEENIWGYGDRAFHYLWWLLVRDAASRFGALRALEIGVFKGQTISLWALIARRLDIEFSITAVSPFEGNYVKPGRIVGWLKRKLNADYRKSCSVGNLHPYDDYLECNRRIFSHFGLRFDDVKAIQGYSNDPLVVERVRGTSYHLVYIDGDHSYEVASQDVANYAPLVVPGGYLVMDDAACDLPGDEFFKGIEEVTRAAQAIPDHGFDNVLNVGHNRVYRRRAD